MTGIQSSDDLIPRRLCQVGRAFVVRLDKSILMPDPICSTCVTESAYDRTAR